MKPTKTRGAAGALFKARRRREGKSLCDCCGWVPPRVSRKRPSDYMLHAHHVLPLSSGGADADTNMTLLCPNCHTVAHAVSPRRWLWETEEYAWYGPTTKQSLLALLRGLLASVGDQSGDQPKEITRGKRA